MRGRSSGITSTSRSVWSSETRATRTLMLGVLVGVLVGVLLAARDAAAQGSVRGTLSLVERPGASPGDLRAAVVWLVDRDAPNAPAREASTATIAMRDREFLPHVLRVPVGGSVAFPNEDPFSHNVFSNVEPAPFDLGLYRRGVTRAASFRRPGVYPIYCNIHSKMVSFVVAVPTRWAAQPAADGGFVIDGVPAGRYVVHAWHERGASELVQELTVPASGVAGVRLAIDARAYVSGPHLNKFGRPYALTRADRY
jgi:plastocyanin